MTLSFLAHWHISTLDAVCSSLTDGDHLAPPKAEKGVPFITISAMNDGNVSLQKATRFVPRSYYESLSESRRARAGDILLSVTGSLGIAAPVTTDAPFVFQRHIAVMRPDQQRIDRRFLLYFLRSPQTRESMAEGATGTAQMTISLGALRRFPVPLPSLAEQRRIVARIEALFARTCRMRVDLERVVALTPYYMARALEQLFNPGDHSWPVEPVSNLATAKLGKMLDGAKNTVGHPLTYLRNINVRWFAFDLSDLLTMRFTDEEATKFSIRDGDVLVCEGGEPGRAAVWRNGRTNIKFQKALHRLRPKAGVQPDWLAFGLRYLADSGQLAEHFTGTTIKHLPGQALATVRLPLPPAEVQTARIAEFQQASVRIESQCREAARALALLDRLEQSILARAFRGELASQDSADAA